MKRRLNLAVGLAAVFSAASMLSAEIVSQAEGQFVRFKTGEVTLTLLDSNGITPMRDAAVKMLSANDGRDVASVVSDAAGRAVLSMDVGRYLLNVSDRTLCVVEVGDDATLTTARVVVPAQGLMAGGAEEGSSTNRTMLVPLLVGGGVVLAAGVGYAIYDNNKDDDEVTEPVTPPTPTPTPAPTPTPTPRPRPPKPSPSEPIITGR